MELRLTGDDLARRKIERTLSGLPAINLEPDADFELAADIYRAVRRGGHTVRSMIDCLIAAVAHRSGAELVHRDVDMERIAAVLPGLRSRSLRQAGPGADRPGPARRPVRRGSTSPARTKSRVVGRV